MSRPVRKTSLSSVSVAGAGTPHSTKGHTDLGLFAVASNLDTVNDALEIRLEIEGPDGEWSPIRDETGTAVGSLSTSHFEDVDGDGATWSAYVKVRGVSADRMRASVTSITDAAGGDLTVDAYVSAAGNSAGVGHGFEE